MDKVKEKASEIKQNSEMQDALYKWQDKFEDAKSNYEEELKLMDERELIYLGTREVDGNINNPVKPEMGRKKANNVRNIVYEFIESQADNSIPPPMVKAKKAENEWKAKMVEDSLKADIDEMSISKLNELQERTTPIQGKSFVEVLWNNDKKNHSWIGEIQLRLIHPKQFIPQPGVWELEDMDYFFIMSSVTKQYIKKRYDYDVDSEEEEYPEINTIGDKTYSSVESNKVTEIVCWYRDEDGDVGRFVWVNNKPLENLPKYYKRMLEKKIKETETIATDIQLKDGTVIPAGTEIPYYTPYCYPIVMRENVPIAFTFGGQSDVDIIRDQQDAIKKVVTKLEEKILKGGSIITLPAAHRGKTKLTDEELKVVYMEQNEMGQINVISMQPDISKDLTFINEQYRAAQYTLGINDSFQGKPDPTAKSGIAKQLQIAQATGRIKSKQANKSDAYKKLYQIMFEFKLAFYDEPRPYITTDKTGKPAYAEFSKYEFIVQDVKEDGTTEWYYDTEYLFTVDSATSLPNDRIFMLNEAKDLFARKALDQLQLWQVLEALHFPMASDIKSQIEEQMQIQEQMQQMQQQMQMMQQENQQLKAAQQQAQPQGQEQQQPNIDEILAELSPEEQQAVMQNPELLEGLG